MSLAHFLHIVKNVTCSAFEKYHLTKHISHLTLFSVKSFKSVNNVQSRQAKCGLLEQIWCSMFKVDRCSMYPGSLPLIFNGSVPGHKKLFNVRRCSMYTGVQFDRFHCIHILELYSLLTNSSGLSTEARRAQAGEVNSWTRLCID